MAKQTKNTNPTEENKTAVNETPVSETTETTDRKEVRKIPQSTTETNIPADVTEKEVATEETKETTTVQATPEKTTPAVKETPVAKEKKKTEESVSKVQKEAADTSEVVAEPTVSTETTEVPIEENPFPPVIPHAECRVKVLKGIAANWQNMVTGRRPMMKKEIAEQLAEMPHIKSMVELNQDDTGYAVYIGYHDDKRKEVHIRLPETDGEFYPLYIYRG